jgi:IPT/TIG domain-containing protein
VRCVLVPALTAALVAVGCENEEPGGITARIVFPDHGSEPASSPGARRRSLDADLVRSQVDRLQILALDVSGSTLAETNLYTNPGEDQLRFDPKGGTWSLTGVRVGKDRQVVANAYLPRMVIPPPTGYRFLRARNTGIEVKSGQVANAGTLNLMFIPGSRYPPLDFDPPSSPNPAMAGAVAAGNALWVTFSRPEDPDVAGYVIAVSAGTVGTPTIARGRPLGAGDSIAPGLTVSTVLASPEPQTVSVSGLENGRSYTLLIYAYDADLDGKPLNYSIPSRVFGFVQDTDPPGAIGNLRIALRSGTTFEITFVAPGEDGDQGTPASYDLRASLSRTTLEDDGSFRLLPMVGPLPTPMPAGANVMFLKTAAELSVLPGRPFFIGMRALDDTMNAGPIAIAAYSNTSTGGPQIQAISPEIAIAGQEVMLLGQGFGSRTPTVTLTYTTTAATRVRLLVENASDTSVLVRVPIAARSGTVALTRQDGMTGLSHLPVILRADGGLDLYPFPFEIVSTQVASGAAFGALYREKDLGSVFEGAIERIIDYTKLTPPLALFNSPLQSTAIAGTYAVSQDRFFFVASNAALSMTAAFCSSSTAAPGELRVGDAVAAGGADRIGLAALGPGSGMGEIPAMIAFSVNGVVRAATVADARVDRFNRFNVYTSTSAAISFDRAIIKRKKDGEILMAHRAVEGMNTTLVVRTNTTARPGDFRVLSTARPLAAGSGFEILAVPTGAIGGPEEFVLVYELRETSERTDVHVLKIADYGTRLGVAPFQIDPLRARHLEDAGLIRRGAATWIAILATLPTMNGVEVEYTEVAVSDLDLPDQAVGSHPGAVLDNAQMGNHGRIGCKETPLSSCPIVWLGPTANASFLRR